MSVLKHLKMLQHVSIIILIIFRELVGSLLMSLNLKVFISLLKLRRLFVIMRQPCHTHTHQTLCCRITTNNLHSTPLHTEHHAHTTNINAALLQITSTAHLSTQNTMRTHQTLCCHITTNNLHSTPLHTEHHTHTQQTLMLPHYHKKSPQHTSPHRTPHTHTTNVMLPHHHK